MLAPVAEAVDVLRLSDFRARPIAATVEHQGKSVRKHAGRSRPRGPHSDPPRSPFVGTEPKPIHPDDKQWWYEHAAISDGEYATPILVYLSRKRPAEEGLEVRFNPVDGTYTAVRLGLVRPVAS